MSILSVLSERVWLLLNMYVLLLTQCTLFVQCPWVPWKDLLKYNILLSKYEMALDVGEGWAAEVLPSPSLSVRRRSACRSSPQAGPGWSPEPSGRDQKDKEKKARRIVKARKGKGNFIYTALSIQEADSKCCTWKHRTENKIIKWNKIDEWKKTKQNAL